MQRQYDKLKREDLEALVASSLELSGEVELEKLLSSILHAACRLTDSPDSGLFLYNQDRDSLYFASATGSKSAQLLDMFGEDSLQQVPLESKAGLVFKTGVPFVNADLSGDNTHYKGADQQTGHTTQSMACVPLEVGGARIGAMQLLNKRAGLYGDRDVQLLETFASHAAVAIRNAKLVEDLLAHMGLSTRHHGTTAFSLMEEMSGPPHEEELTVLFADMRSFTQLAQVVTPAELQRLLNQYLTMLCDEVLRYDGVVNKLVGDGIVALFRRSPDHPRRAVECAFAMVENFDRLKQQWEQSSNVALSFLDIGIGIATDTVTLATFGSRQVKDYTPIGTGVNLANAFEVAARDGKRILSNQSTYNAVRDLVKEVKDPETFRLTKPGQDVGHPYKVYQLLNAHKGSSPSGHVFFAHNSDDKPTVRNLAKALRERGVEVWLDEENLVPGRSGQAGIEDGMVSAGSAAVIVGPSGLGPWEIPEMRAALIQSVRRGMPVIPVLLPGAPEEKELPMFLQDLTWVDLRAGITSDGVDRLEWGIRHKDDD